MSEPIVNIKQGKLLGKIAQNLDGKDFLSFQGIPYAKPPIGELRFKDPQPPNPWNGTRDATKEGSACYARDFILQTYAGSEDCLFANVFTPQLDGSRPVMVWIHGGGFTSGSGSAEVYGPEYLVTQDIVLVTFNYRLGILGFLSLDDPILKVPGNAGLKDMVMALKWVRDNISNFGGDPKNVTIFGESAGGAAVHYLILSPMGKGLFHKAIAQSGTAINNFAKGRRFAKELAAKAGLKTTHEAEILEYFKSLTVEKLLEISEELPETLFPDELRPYSPVIERISGPQAFLSQEPIEIMNFGGYNQVPFMLGYTTREGIFVEYFINPSKPLEMPTDFQRFVPISLNCKRDSEESKKIAEKLKNFYYGTPGSENDRDVHFIFQTDVVFYPHIILSTIRHAENSKTPTYLYRVSVDTKFNLFKKIYGVDVPGVSHGDEIGFLFKTKMNPNFETGSLEDITVRRFVKLWTDFAKYGDHKACKPVKGKDEINYLDIGENLEARVGPEPERTALWRDIFQVHPAYKF